MFCHHCITDWAKIRSWCPLCQGPVHPLIRIYSVDEQIEKYYLTNFSREEREEFDEAKNRRLEEQRIRAEQEKRFTARLFRRWTDLKLYFRSKGVLRGLANSCRRRTSFKWFSGQLWIGILIGCLLTCLVILYCFTSFSLLHFISYMYTAIKNYPGSDPVIVVDVPETECGLNDMSRGTLIQVEAVAAHPVQATSVSLVAHQVSVPRTCKVGFCRPYNSVDENNLFYSFRSVICTFYSAIFGPSK